MDLFWEGMHLSFHPLECYGSGFCFKERDDFKVKWIAQIVQFVVFCFVFFFFTIREERSAKATQ